MKDAKLYSRSVVFVKELKTLENTAPGAMMDISGEDFMSKYIDDFTLAENQIVDGTWPKAEKPDLNPFSSKIKYKNGIAISGELNKVLFQNFDTLTDPHSHDFENRSIRLLDYLSDDNHFTQLGINFSIISPADDMCTEFTANFLKPETFKNINKPVTRALLKSSYKLGENSNLNLQIATVYKKELDSIKNDTSQKEEFIVYDFNFSFKFDEADGNKALRLQLAKANDFLANAQSYLSAN